MQKEKPRRSTEGGFSKFNFGIRAWEGDELPRQCTGRLTCARSRSSALKGATPLKSAGETKRHTAMLELTVMGGLPFPSWSPQIGPEEAPPLVQPPVTSGLLLPFGLANPEPTGSEFGL